MPCVPHLFLACMAATLATSPCAAREIGGSLIHLQRSAFPADAVVQLEARNGTGQILAETSTATEGAQVPIPFAVEVPADTDLTLTAAIFIGGRPAWIAPPVAVAAGTAPVSLGELQLGPYRPFGPETLDCASATFGFEPGPDGGLLRFGPRVLHLTPDAAAPGARLAAVSDRTGTWVWNKGNEWTVSLDGREFAPCRFAMPDVRPWRAGGNEPSWQVTVAGGEVSLARLGTEGTVTGPLPEPVTESEARRYDVAGTALVLRVRETICLDSMTGMAHPQTVTLTEGTVMLSGCGGDPATLLRGPDWRLTSLDGATVPDAIEITLRFDGQGRISGKGACNRYAGSYTLTGETLSFGPAAATRMACPEPQMAMEREFHAMLPRVTRFDIGEGGILRLIAGDEVVAEARP